jgi:lipopolysaccharide/colanic/teichoic acid biosynthesis glycosyltransferase
MVRGFDPQNIAEILADGEIDALVPIAEAPASPLPERSGYAIAKRCFDLVLSTVALFLMAPLCLVVAAIVRATTPGPVIYRQTRIGRGGVPFECLKFRTMVNGAHQARADVLALNEMAPPVFKIRRDPRVTAVGRFLRRYSIDEIPQFVNVLRGDMSVVGPRPPLPEEVAKYRPGDRQRLAVAQGITCLWQVSGRGRVGFDEWMRLDAEYIARRSFWLDLLIVVRTVPAVLSGRGAA